MNTLMSVISVSVYVYDTYVSIDELARVMYLVCSITFSVEYVAKLLAADDVLSYLFWDWSLVDMATIVYGIAYFVDLGLGTDLGFIRLLRIIQVVRLCKSVTFIVLQYTRRTSQPMQLEYVRRSADLAVTLVAVVFISACVFYELEVVQEDLYLHNAIYWACVTISTIGYGDYAPETVTGQLLFPLIIIIVILILPRKISHLFEVMQNFSRFIRRSHRSHRFGKHVVLTGHVTSLSAQTFISEFYHQGRGYQDMDVVLLCPSDPDPPLVITMNNPRWEDRVKYLNGSPYQAEDLARADTGRALAVFVLADKYSADPAAEDSRTLLAVLAVAQFLRQFAAPEDLPPPRVVSWSATSWKGRYCQSSESSHPHIIAQFLLNETLDHAIALLRSGAKHPPEMGLIPLDVSPFPICVGSLRASLLGAALHTPGLISLVTNLCISSSLGRRRTLMGHTEDASMLSNCGWLSEYLRGASVEIYDVAFPEPFWGLTFKQAALKLWHEEEVILIGVRQANHRDAEQSFDVKLAPMGGWAAAAAGSGSRGATDGQQLLIDGSTQGYILSVDALVLGSAPRSLVNPLEAQDKDAAMRLSMLYLRHQQHQQQQPQQQQQGQQPGARPAHWTEDPIAAAATACTLDSANGDGELLAGDGRTLGTSTAYCTPLRTPLGSLNDLTEGGPAVAVAGGPFGAATVSAIAAAATTADDVGGDGSGGGGDGAASLVTPAPSGTASVSAIADAPTVQVAVYSARQQAQSMWLTASGHATWLARQSMLVAKMLSGRYPAPENGSAHSVEAAIGSGGSAAASPEPHATLRRSFPADARQRSTLSRRVSFRDVAAADGPGLSAGGGGCGGGGLGVATSTRRQQGMKAATRLPDLHALAAVSSFSYRRATERRATRQATARRGDGPTPASASESASASGSGSGSGSASYDSADSDPGKRGGGGSEGEGPPRVQRQASWRRQRRWRPTREGEPDPPPQPPPQPPPPSPPPLQQQQRTPECRRPRVVDTFAGGPPLDSPVLVMGSSCFVQLVGVVGAIRSAPPVGFARSFRTRTIVILDDGTEEKAALSDNQLAALGSLPGAIPDRIFMLRANPLDAADLEKLNLKPHGSVAALLVPSRKLFTEEAVAGSAPALADGQMLVAAAALRRYCQEMDCELRVVAEVLALLNCSYALPLCLAEGPYHHHHRHRHSHHSSNKLERAAPYPHVEADTGPCAGLGESSNSGSRSSREVRFITDPRPDFRRGVHNSLRRLGRQSDQARQEDYVQQVLSEMPHLSPSLAPGHILMQTFLDALTCQAGPDSIFNPMMLQILLKMLNCWELTSSDPWARLQRHHAHAHAHLHQQERQRRRSQPRQQRQGLPPRRSPCNDRPPPPAFATAAAAGPGEPPQPQPAAAAGSWPGRAPNSPASLSHSGMITEAAPLKVSQSGRMGTPAIAPQPAAAAAAPVSTAPFVNPQPAPAWLHAASEPLWASPPPPPSPPSPSGGQGTAGADDAVSRPGRLTGVGRSGDGGRAEPPLRTAFESLPPEREAPEGGASGSAGPCGRPVEESTERPEVLLAPPPPLPPPAAAPLPGPGAAAPGPGSGLPPPDLPEAAGEVPLASPNGTHGSVGQPGVLSPRQSAPTRFQREAVVGSSRPLDPPLVADGNGETANPLNGGCGGAGGRDGVRGSDDAAEMLDWNASVTSPPRPPPPPAPASRGYGTASAAAACADDGGSVDVGSAGGGGAGGGGAGGGGGSGGDPAVVRLFCLSFGGMLERFTGLTELLRSVQDSQRRLTWNPASRDLRHHLDPSHSQSQSQQYGVGGAGPGPRRCPQAAADGFSTARHPAGIDPATSAAGMSTVGDDDDDEARRRHGLQVTFGVLFEVLVLEYDMLPLALYRRGAAAGGGGGVGGSGRRWAAAAPAGGAGGAGGRAHASTGMPYVYTKPDKHGTWMRESDDVYVLASQAVVVRFWGEEP
ncbi:hypothetical protein PLESTM_001206000 [Pleodorina starrii]|nr:hypothetical protein PLESTM_001206000 [Pleodorina starrii]